MDEHAIRKILEGGGGLPGGAVRKGLWLPGKLYGALMRMRRAAYAQGVLPSFRPGVPTISIGNLTAGGSGKTPLTIMLAQEFLKQGLRPGILLRGYRQSAGGQSDEAVLYRRLCPRALLQVGANRRAGAERAMEEGANVLLMDDGFQHLKVQRDVDIVLIDATAPWGGGNTLPGGLLREPLSAVRAAAAVILTRSDQVAPGVLEALRKETALLAPNALLLAARHRPARLDTLAGDSLPLAQLRGQKVVALSGIARPEAFHATLAGLGAILVDAFAGKDHEHFTPALVHSVVETAREKQARVVITEKDRAKNIFTALAASHSVDNNNVKGMIWSLGVEQEVFGKETLLSLLGNLFQ